jgi:hypothetical protein
MTFVVASAFRAALGRLILAFGLLAVVFTALTRSNPLGGMMMNPRASAATIRLLIRSVSFPHSPWDYPIAIGIAAASVLVAALIYPGAARSRPTTT